MHDIRAAAGRQEQTVAFAERHLFPAAVQSACALGDEQRHKGGLVRNAFKLAGDGIHGEVVAPGQMAAKIQFFGRAQFGDSQCLLDVQGDSGD